jgi:pantoate--beta-alanine ligase
MIILKTVAAMQHCIAQKKLEGKRIGFVPTMGALHQGHLTLINSAKAAPSFVVSSIFVNPTQFNDPKDFEKYPTTVEKDIYALEKTGCDVLFLPSVAEMYPNGTKSKISYQLGLLDTVLDAAHRPGHFQGVCQVVHRLLEIVQPHQLFVGQKDYQQCQVLKKLIQITESETAIIICPTEREKSGLAMSSRNMRLSDADKVKAAAIFETLQSINNSITEGDIEALKVMGKNTLTEKGFIVDYVEIANADTLKLINIWDGTTPMVILVAAFLNGVRLIDNLVVNAVYHKKSK